MALGFGNTLPQRAPERTTAHSVDPKTFCFFTSHMVDKAPRRSVIEIEEASPGCSKKRTGLAGLLLK
jgi:hypothetical protein